MYNKLKTKKITRFFWEKDWGWLKESVQSPSICTFREYVKKNNDVIYIRDFFISFFHIITFYDTGIFQFFSTVFKNSRDNPVKYHKLTEVMMYSTSMDTQNYRS